MTRAGAGTGTAEGGIRTPGCRPPPWFSAPSSYFVVLGGGSGDAATDCGETLLA